MKLTNVELIKLASSERLPMLLDALAEVACVPIGTLANQLTYQAGVEANKLNKKIRYINEVLTDPRSDDANAIAVVRDELQQTRQCEADLHEALGILSVHQTVTYDMAMRILRWGSN